MKRLAVLVSLVVLVLVAPSLTFGAEFYKNWEIGLVGKGRSLQLNSSAIPEAVKREATNPSIINPYSGRVFGKEQIGTYDPAQTFSFFEGGLFIKYTVPLRSAIKPYARLEFQYPFDVSTHKGEYGRGYSYEKVLGSGVDYVRYTYGIEYKYPLWLEPEIGLSYVKENSYSVSFGVGYQRLEG